MKILYLEYYVALVANDFNITKTSKNIHVSQPALSKSINSIEERYEKTLFLRKNKRIVGMTELGQEVYLISLQILSAHNNLMSLLRAKSEKEIIKIGVPPSFLNTYLSKIILKLINQNPQLKLSIIEEGGTILNQKLMDKQIDIAFLLPTSNDENIVSLPIFQDEIVAYMNKNHVLKSEKKLSLQTISQQNLCTLDNSFLLKNQIFQHFIQENIIPNFTLESSSWEFLFQYCEEFDAITLLPKTLFNFIPNKKQIIYKELSPSLSLKINLCYLKSNTDYLREIIKSLLDIQSKL